MNKNNNPNETQYCVITEQGDLGLGVTPLNEQDNQTYKKYIDEKNKSSK